MCQESIVLYEKSSKFFHSYAFTTKRTTESKKKPCIDLTTLKNETKQKQGKYTFFLQKKDLVYCQKICKNLLCWWWVRYSQKCEVDWGLFSANILYYIVAWIVDISEIQILGKKTKNL